MISSTNVKYAELHYHPDQMLTHTVRVETS